MVSDFRCFTSTNQFAVVQRVYWLVVWEQSVVECKTIERGWPGVCVSIHTLEYGEIN